MDRFTSMLVFVRTVERGSFAAAAAESDMTATMVGNHIRALERRLGSRLLNRTTRRQSLTEIGRGYYEHCISILAQLQSAENDAREMYSRPRGRLRISVPTIYATRKLAPAMRDYLDRYPEVHVELVLDDRYVDLADGGFDAAIRVGALPDSNLIARPLAPSPHIVCAAPAYLAKHGIPETPKDLERHQCLAFVTSNGPERDWRFTLADGSQQTIRVPGRLDINGGLALREAALAALGIILQPALMLENDMATGKLVRLFADLPAPTFPVHVVYLPERKLTAKLASFVDFMTARL